MEIHLELEDVIDKIEEKQAQIIELAEEIVVEEQRYMELKGEQMTEDNKSLSSARANLKRDSENRKTGGAISKCTHRSINSFISNSNGRGSFFQWL